MPRELPSESEARAILARRKSRPAPRPAPPVGRALQPLIRKLDDRYGRGAGALEPRWREIVGDRLAKVTQPIKLTRGRNGSGATLELRVAGPAALLVQHQSAEILAQVNLFLGEGAVEKLRISQGPVRGLQAASAPARRAIKPPLPAEAEAELSKSVEAAPEGLKAALTRLGRAVMGGR
ncbi:MULTISPECIES: DUF721 domain-containing protein [Brevundimonas]|uniref:DUF721 domain-containing protein n=1 Tax=Brevundimonas TaxID=41275 RepID=UPI000F0133B6|nr:DciA family protein [Brevundimonas lutea]